MPPFPVPVGYIPRLVGDRPKRTFLTSDLIAKPHAARNRWWATSRNLRKPIDVVKYNSEPRILLRRHLYQQQYWSRKEAFPDPSRWEVIVNSARATEERSAFVEEAGMQHRVSWLLLSNRMVSELKAARESLPQYTFKMLAAPIHFKQMDRMLHNIKGLSVREAMAQGKLSNRKGLQIAFHCLERAVQGAEGKGLDREKLRVLFATCWPGPADKQIDIRSKGYYSWKTKRTTHILVTVGEDPEMILPDRSQLPYSSLVALKKAGLYSEAVVLDVPAITADGI